MVVRDLSFGDKYLTKKVYENGIQKISRYNLEKDSLYTKMILSINETSIEKDRYVDSKGKVEHNLHFKISDNKLNELLKKATR